MNVYGPHFYKGHVQTTIQEGASKTRVRNNFLQQSVSHIEGLDEIYAQASTIDSKQSDSFASEASTIDSKQFDRERSDSIGEIVYFS